MEEKGAHTYTEKEAGTYMQITNGNGVTDSVWKGQRLGV